MLRDTLEVRTAENVELGWDIAGIGSRLLATLVDLLLVGLIDTGVLLLLLALVPEADTGAAIVLGSFLTFVVLVGYFVVAETATGGRSPGKRALGLRVIRTDGGAAGFGEALVRGLLRIVDLAVGVVPMFATASSRRLGDFAAGTVVVRERRARSVPPPPPPAILRTPDAGPSIDNTAALGSHELVALRAFLSRQGLAPEQRGRLAATLAARLYDRLDLPASAPERSWPAELFIERLYLQLASRAGQSA
ncbi:MAG TPA: RDD family protein [Candidatus Dormibacteraeota bacterium]|nr:RDD family protein [Candidatus Dormibacteraeota bacterium]